MYRHGDVIIVEAQGVPIGARRQPGGVLARGEATGHSHRVAEAGSAEVYELGAMGYLHVVADSATLIHDEHAAITLTKGVYRFWKQREYTPQEIRTVID